MNALALVAGRSCVGKPSGAVQALVARAAPLVLFGA
jgi:hypothetical protein